MKHIRWQQDCAASFTPVPLHDVRTSSAPALTRFQNHNMTATSTIHLATLNSIVEEIVHPKMTISSSFTRAPTSYNFSFFCETQKEILDWIDKFQFCNKNNDLYMICLQGEETASNFKLLIPYGLILVSYETDYVLKMYKYNYKWDLSQKGLKQL